MQTYAVSLTTVGAVTVISCAGITTHLPADVRSSSTADAMEMTTDSILNLSAGKRAVPNRRKVGYVT